MRSMKNVKMPTCDRYREFLIECLKDPEQAAGYIEAILEEENPKPKLLENALKKVVEAYARSNQLSESAKQHHEKLDRMLAESRGSEIYTFVKLLNALGFRVAIAPKETQQ